LQQDGTPVMTKVQGTWHGQEVPAVTWHEQKVEIPPMGGINRTCVDTPGLQGRECSFSPVTILKDKGATYRWPEVNFAPGALLVFGRTLAGVAGVAVLGTAGTVLVSSAVERARKQHFSAW